MSTRQNRAFYAAQPSTGRYHPTLALSAIAVALLLSSEPPGSGVAVKP